MNLAALTFTWWNFTIVSAAFSFLVYLIWSLVNPKNYRKLPPREEKPPPKYFGLTDDEAVFADSLFGSLPVGTIFRWKGIEFTALSHQEPYRLQPISVGKFTSEGKYVAAAVQCAYADRNGVLQLIEFGTEFLTIPGVEIVFRPPDEWKGQPNPQIINPKERPHRGIGSA